MQPDAGPQSHGLQVPVVSQVAWLSSGATLTQHAIWRGTGFHSLKTVRRALEINNLSFEASAIGPSNRRNHICIETSDAVSQVTGPFGDPEGHMDEILMKRTLSQLSSEDAPMAPMWEPSFWGCMTEDRSIHLCEGPGVAGAPRHEAGGQPRGQRCKHQLIGQQPQPRLRGGRCNFLASCVTGRCAP